MTTSKEFRASLTWGKRLLIVLVILAAIVAGVFKMAERSPDALRLGLQDYLTQVSGHPAEITKLEKARLFPAVEFVLKDILVRDKENADRVLVSVERAHLSAPMWRLFLGLRDYSVVRFENMAFATGYITPKKLAFHFAGILDSDPLNAPPYMVLDGVYNGRDFFVTALARRHGAPSYHYDMAHQFPLTFKIGGTEGTALFARGNPEYAVTAISLMVANARAELSAPKIAASPLSAPFSGTIGEVPVTGALTREEGDVLRLSIQADTSIKSDLANIRAFVQAIQDDLGLSGDDIEVDITPAAVAKENDTINKE